MKKHKEKLRPDEDKDRILDIKSNNTTCIKLLKFNSVLYMYIIASR